MYLQPEELKYDPVPTRTHLAADLTAALRIMNKHSGKMDPVKVRDSIGGKVSNRRPCTRPVCWELMCEVQ